jgi:murein DD-endopeptidase MepM/ murein hydrolase activator NlpD
MQKKAFVLHVSIAVALCAMGFTAPAAADDGPIAPPTPRADLPRSLPQASAAVDAVIEHATSTVTSGPAPVIPAPAPARAAPVARSAARTFSTYDALIDYANSVATTQQASGDRLAALMAREEANRAALTMIFDPRARGGLLRSRTEVIDDATLRAIKTELANDAQSVRRLVADGAAVTAPTPWQLPLLGEDTQDFGPTPYYFEPPLTYGGVEYPHFHTGTDIAAAWGTPILAPARGMVVFAGMMGDGAEVVVIAHDSGLVSMYAHLMFVVPVRAGEAVQAGDRIGNVGLTGNTTGAHLHWSVWRNGGLIDPLSMILRGEEPTPHFGERSEGRR